jgi:D-alanyl-D-alanine carboxypeptidase
MLKETEKIYLSLREFIVGYFLVVLFLSLCSCQSLSDISQINNTTITPNSKKKCPNIPSGSLANPEGINIDGQTVQKTGKISSDNDMGFVFQGKQGQKLSYSSNDNDKLCVWVYTPDNKIFSGVELPVNGTYIVHLASLEKTTTFKIEMQLSASQQKAVNLIEPTNSIYQNPEVDRERQKLIASETYLGHFLYPQGDTDRMVIISSYGARQYQRFEYLHPEAAEALMNMIYTARDEGVWLVPVSGFRTLEEQQFLFERQIQKRGTKENAAKVSAPPGHSEHHTGFAIDLTDGNFPKKDLTIDFENTPAYQWLINHAQEFGFELSFPRNNLQGVSYEPWHWRYIGSPEAIAVFAQARKF